ncbi:T9SS type A sorting domain-containing protein [Flavobacteriaceae bacterium]|nr:T9SS type A sorting domain-containing protein [Flavobacteriaceae bacterium]
MKKSTFILGFFLLLFSSIEAQDYLEMMNSNQYTVLEVQNAAEAYFETRDKGRGTGYKSFKRWEYDAIRMQDDNGLLKSPSFYYNELERYNSYKNSEAQLGRMSMVSNWEQLGPSYWNQTSGWNPGVGRITSIAIDPTNEDHIIIGSPGGGVWKTTDGTTTWTALTDNLSNIEVYALTIHPTDSNTYLWGTSYGVIYKSTDAGATWNLLADTGNGRINKILIDPTNTNKMFCSGEFDGVYKSVDAGQTWALIHPESTTGFDVEFKPGDTNTIYASGNSFFKSTDGGQSFEIINNAFDPLVFWSQEYMSQTTDWAVAESNHNSSVTAKSGSKLAILTLFSASNSITKLITPAIDLSGISDSTLNFSFTNVNIRYPQNPANPFKIFYKTGVSEPWSLLATIPDEVSAWEDVSIPLPDPSGDYYIAFEGHSYYASEVTLDDISVESPTQGVVYSDGFEAGANPDNFLSGPKMIGVSANNPEVVYVVEAAGRIFGGFYKSTDSGANFTELDHAGKNYFGYTSDASDDKGQAPRDMDIIVNPSDVNDVHIAGVLSWRSTNGGTDFTVTSQWQPGSAANENIGYCHADIDLMIYHNDKIYVGSDGGIFVANDPLNVSSTYYTDLTTGLGIRQFYKIGISQTNPVIVSGGSQDNGTSVYRADGVWYDWLGADGMETFIDHSNPNVLYGTSQYGTLYKSYDQGVSRNWINHGYFDDVDGPDGSWVTPFEQDPNVAATLYSGYREIYKSLDGGDTWTSISQDFGSTANHLKIAPSDSNTMYAAFGSNLYKTTNGGSVGDWAQLTGFSGGINSIAIHPTDSNKLAIATNSSEKVYISSDGGQNWSVTTHDLPSFSALALVWDITYGEDILYLGMNYGIYYLRANETTWTSYNTDLPNVQVNELEINTADNKLYAATYGRGLWRVDLYNPAGLGVNDLLISDLIVSPNPTTGTFKMNWKLNDPVTIKIYDTLGKLVFYEKNRDLSRNPEIELQAPQGLYFLKVNTLNQEITKKLIIN